MRTIRDSNIVTDVATIMRRHRVTAGQLAHAADRRLETVMAWLDGTSRPPVYIALTIEAVARKLTPLTHDQMFAYSGDLGVPRETEHGWRFQHHFPTPARLAGALLDWRKYAPPEITQHDRKIVSQVNRAGAYYRVTGGWRARPIMGKTPAMMKAPTPTHLIALGYLKNENGRLTVTDKGRDLIYGKQ